MTPSAQHYLHILRNLPLFKEVRQEDLETLAASVRTMYVKRKTILFQRGDPCEGFYLLLYGRVKLSLNVRSSLDASPAIDKPLDIVTPGGCIGEITMLQGCPYYLRAQALEDSSLLFVPRNVIVRLIERDSHFAMRMLAGLSMRMRNVIDDIEAFSLQPPAARLVTYLMRLLPLDSVTPTKINLSINKSIVAAQLNLTPETLSRYFRELINLGLVSLEGRTVLIHDVDRLNEYAAKWTRRDS